jgi:hypothetical protein
VSIRGLGSGGLALVVSVVVLGSLALPAFAAEPQAPETGAASAVGATTATLNGVLNPNAAGEVGTYDFLYRASASECTEGSTAPEPPGIALGVEKEHVSLELTGLLPGTQYTFCLLARNAAEETSVGTAVSFTTPAAAPVVSEENAAQVTADGATLGAQIDPGGAATTYHFQYGTSAAYGQSTPESSSVGADDTNHGAVAHIQGLAPAGTYHYRVVATNSAAPGGVDGPDLTFTTQPPGTPSALPDGRGYELVTPVEKGDGSLPPPSNPLGVNPGFRASTSGDGLAYSVETAFPGALAGGPDNYLAARGGSGWSSQSITPPQAATEEDLRFPSVMGYSADLSKAAFADGGEDSVGVGAGQDVPALIPGEPQNNLNLFLRDNATSSYQLLNLTPAAVTPDPAGFEGASADFSHVLFISVAQLTPDALNGHGSTADNLYEWAGGSLSLAGQIPTAPATRCGGGGPTCSAPVEGAVLGGGDRDIHNWAGFLNAVSPDASRVFFKSGAGPSSGQLYVRENDARTTEISASQKTNGTGPGGSDPAGPRFPLYWPASADGSKAFFTSCEQLTNDSTANASEQDERCNSVGTILRGADLYRYDTNTGTLSDLTVDHNGDPFGADVKAVFGASADGSYVYFVANGVLAGGASQGDCLGEGSPKGQCNLYVSHNGSTSFIARIDGAGGNDAWSAYLTTARVTPDGTRLAFETTRSLTGYDNTLVSGSQCGTNERGNSFGAQCPEVYLYDATSQQLRCVSCNPSGARPLGPAHLSPIEMPSSGSGAFARAFEYLPRNLSEDGTRVFFNSSDALVPGDVNARQDVYEYEGGRLYLTSSGTSSDDSRLIDASLSGNDVFFTTRSRLVGQDTDQKLDIYDARVGGGFPFTAPSPVCVGESCRPSPAVQPAGVSLGSGSTSGAGNLPPGPVPVTVARRGSLTRAQKLAAALKACQRKPRRRRASCVAHARRLYGPARAAGKTTKSARGTK